MEKRIVLPIALALIVVSGAALVLSPEEEAEAGFSKSTLSELTAFARSDQPLNLRLMALDALRKKTGSGVVAELAKVARGSDAEIAVYAATQLGRKKSSPAKTSLKSLVTDGKLTTGVRKAAMTAIAVHFKSSADLTWMKSAVKGDAKLAGHATWLGTNVYGK